MKRSFVPILLVAILIVSAASALAQRPAKSSGGVRQVIHELEQDTDHFKSSLDGALDRSTINGTRAEDTINEYVERFEKATDRLRDRAEDRGYAPGAAKEVLNRARSINVFMRTYKLGPEAERDWSRVRNDLIRLANAYNIKSPW